uniref:Uncharacterized protein n=1 Tax=Arundo donax TaxID=35708 RepID=A0A0A9FAA7_ARUDO
MKTYHKSQKVSIAIKHFSRSTGKQYLKLRSQAYS